MSNTATCANCHKIIHRDRYARWWCHDDLFASCGPGLGTVAEPIPKKPSDVRHFGNSGYRPACGTMWSENLDTSNDWKETTCQRCMGTLNFKKAKGMTVKEPVANPQKCVHCAEPIEFHNWSGRWLHTRGPNEPDYEWCQNQDGDGLRATPPPLSPLKIEVTAPPPPEQENAAVNVLRRAIRDKEEQLAEIRSLVKQDQGHVDEWTNTLRSRQTREAQRAKELDELNHALNLIGNA